VYSYEILIFYYVMQFFFQAEDGIRDFHVTGVQTCALPICKGHQGGSPQKKHQQDDASDDVTGQGHLAAPPSGRSGPRAPPPGGRSEERRVGKEWSERGGTEQEKEEQSSKGDVEAGTREAKG